MYSVIAIEVYDVSDLHCKQRPDESLQENIQNFTSSTEKAMGTYPANITNREIIFLFVKNYITKTLENE